MNKKERITYPTHSHGPHSRGHTALHTGLKPLIPRFRWWRHSHSLEIAAKTPFFDPRKILETSCDFGLPFLTQDGFIPVTMTRECTSPKNGLYFTQKFEIWWLNVFVNFRCSPHPLVTMLIGPAARLGSGGWNFFFSLLLINTPVN